MRKTDKPKAKLPPYRQAGVPVDRLTHIANALLRSMDLEDHPELHGLHRILILSDERESPKMTGLGACLWLEKDATTELELATIIATLSATIGAIAKGNPALGERILDYVRKAVIRG